MLCCSIYIKAWKDNWLSQWEHAAIEFMNAHHTESTYPVYDCSDCPVTMPMYSGAKILSNTTQIIPRAIWQTSKSVRVNPAQFQVMTELILKNPDYEYYLFDDDNALNFICTFYPDLALIYQQTISGAIKADIWRLAVIYKYGGVYVDIDTFLTTPLQDMIWPNASLVSGLEPSGSLHSWLLIYAPAHPIIGTALKKLTNRLKRLSNRMKTSTTSSRATTAMREIDSSRVLHVSMIEIFRMYQCSAYSPHKETAVDRVLSLSQRPAGTAGLGVMQVYSGDNLGDHVLFRDIDTARERHQAALYYSDIGNKVPHSALFQHIGVHVAGRSTWKIGMCLIDRQ